MLQVIGTFGPLSRIFTNLNQPGRSLRLIKVFGEWFDPRHRKCHILYNYSKTFLKCQNVHALVVQYSINGSTMFFEIKFRVSFGYFEARYWLKITLNERMVNLKGEKSLSFPSICLRHPDGRFPRHSLTAIDHTSIGLKKQIKVFHSI